MVCGVGWESKIKAVLQLYLTLVCAVAFEVCAVGVDVDLAVCAVKG
jgi:hypothetical protein